MITRVNGPQVWQRWKEAKRLALLAIFEDSVTGMRVKEFCQGLSRNLGEQCQIVDLVVISVHQAEGLPDDVKNWIDLWLRQKGSRHAVLLALLDPPYEGGAAPTEAYLEEIAARGGMEFLVESTEFTGRP
jgi:hypothetical protein